MKVIEGVNYIFKKYCDFKSFLEEVERAGYKTALGCKPTSRLEEWSKMVKNREHFYTVIENSKLYYGTTKEHRDKRRVIVWSGKKGNMNNYV